MQTPAEKQLVETISSFLLKKNIGDIPKILNIGAGKSLSIENQLNEQGCSFVCDRVDIENHQIESQFIGNCYQCSIEYMRPVKSSDYDVAFSNYVLEHVQNLNTAACEIHRILEPDGIFVASVPNPTALEVLAARLTPLWLHKVVRGVESWETYYAYSSINALSHIFQDVGFDTIGVKYWSFFEGYMERFVILNKLAHLYDKILNTLQLKVLMGNVCIVFKKCNIREGTY